MLAVALSDAPSYLKVPGPPKEEAGVVHLWALSSPAPSESFSVEGGYIKGWFTPDAMEMVLLNAEATTIERWSATERKPLTRTPLPVKPVHLLTAVLSPDGEHLVGQQDAKVEGNRIVQAPLILNTRTGQHEASISVPGGGFPQAFRADGRAMAFLTAAVEKTPPPSQKKMFAGVRQSLTLVEYPGGSPLGRASLKSGFNVPTSCVFSPDGREAAVAFIGEIGLSNFETGQYSAVATKDKALTVAMIWSPDGKRLAFGDNAAVRVWTRPDPRAEAREGRDSEPVRLLRGHSKAVTALAFSPDGAILASAADNESVRLWDVVTSQERAVLPPPTGGVSIRSLAFTSNGRELRALSLPTGRVVRWLSDAPNVSP
jgi:WD40 repeat protein